MNMHIDMDAFLQTLPIMGKGMAGIFLVTGVIVLCVLVLRAVSRKMDDKQEK